MPAADVWTVPSTLDRTTGQILPVAYWVNAISDLLYLYNALFGATRALSVNQLTVAPDLNAMLKIGRYNTGGNDVGIIQLVGSSNTFLSIRNHAGVEIAQVDAQGNIISPNPAAATSGTPALGPLITSRGSGYNSVNGSVSLQAAFRAGVANNNANPVYGSADLWARRYASAGGAADFLVASLSELAATFYAPIQPSVGVANNVMTRLYSVVLGSDTGAYTFSGIPATYRNLRLDVRSRSTVAQNNDTLVFRLNGDSTGVYHYQRLSSDGTVASITGAGSVNQTSCAVMWAPAANVTITGWFGTAAVTFSDYSSSTATKAGTSVWSGKGSSGVSDMATGMYGWEWEPSAPAAINQIQVFFLGGSMRTGTALTLYGLPQ